MKANKGGRPRGARNIRPTSEAIAAYYQMLKNAADGGSIQAAAALIQLHKQDCIEQAGSRNGEV